MSWNWITSLFGRTLFWLLACASFIPGNADDSSSIRGIPGKDYPNYSSIPQTSFRCSEQPHIPGLYADLETRCQVFHYCYEHRQESFLCPLGTVFNQAILACDYWYSADCSAAPLYYGGENYDDPPHQAIIYDTEPGTVPIKTTPDNLFDKMASLYEVNDGSSSLNDSGNEADYLEGTNSFSDIDRSLIFQRKPVIENKNYGETIDHYGRHDGVLDELPKDYDYVQNSEDLEDNFQNFEDSFEGSGEFLGESKELEEEVLSHGGYLWPSNGIGNFEDRQFAIMQEEHVEEQTKPHDHSYYKDESMDPLTDTLHSSSKESSVPGEKLVKRYSENNVNPYSRKSTRRKPIFIVNESPAEITTTEMSGDKESTNSFDPGDQSTTSGSTEPMTTSKLPDTLATSYKAKRRRKPITINLEDSLQYNIDNTRYLDGGASVNYEVNTQSEVPELSIATQELSVKLIPSETKRKPAGEYLSNYYNRENEEKTESETVSYITNPESNINYETTTFPTYKESEMSDVAVSIDRINQIRKKDEIRINDSDNKHFGINDDEHYPTPLQTLQFEDETLTQPVEEFQDIEDTFSDISEETKEISEQELMPEISLEEDDVATDPSYFIPEHDQVILSNIVPDSDDILRVTQDEPDIFKMYEGLDQSYIPYINHESSLETEQFEGVSDIHDKTDSIIIKSLPRFDFPTYDKMKYETHFTTESISDITTIPLEIHNTDDSTTSMSLEIHNTDDSTTIMPLEIHNTDDLTTSMPLEIHNTDESESNFYFIPQSHFESEYAHSGISTNAWRPVPVTLEENNVRGQLESGSFDLHPSYHLFLEDSIRDETAELTHSEDIELQTMINDYGNETEIERIPKAELIDHKKRTSVSSMSKDIASNNYVSFAEATPDKLPNAELLDHLSHSNESFNFTAKLDSILTESKQAEDSALKDATAKQSLEIQPYIMDETVDFDAMKKREEGDTDHNALLELNSPQPENTEHKGKAESDGIQGAIDLSKDTFETANQFDSVTQVTSNSVAETSENTPFLESFDAFQNGDFNYDQKLLENLGIKSDQLKTTEKPSINKDHSVFLTNLVSTENVKTRPLRSAKALASPYQMGFNMRDLSSQYLAGFPSTMLKLNPSNIKKFLPNTGPDFEDGTFYARTGGLLESPKISKLISIGKNLLRAKRAKYRILNRYINAFNSNK